MSYSSQVELFEDISRRLVELGYVNEDFEASIKEREAHFPTGLPLNPPVAIPHTDGTHVKRDAIVCIRNDREISFNEIGAGPESVLEIRLMFMLVIASGDGHIDELQRLINNLQDNSLVEAALYATTNEAFRDAADNCVK